MKLGEETSKCLNKWLAPNTWFKTHQFDLDRFYDFVNWYQKEHGYTIDEADLRQEIIDRLKKQGNYVSEELKDIIRYRISTAYTILDFLKRTGR